MGTTVLDPGPSPASSLHLYAHCLRNHAGGVALLVINASKDQAQTLQVPTASQRYTPTTAHRLEDAQVLLNGEELKLGAGDALPELKGVDTPSAPVTFEPESITFLGIAAARNASCR